MGWFNRNQNENSKDNIVTPKPMASGSVPPPIVTPSPLTGPVPSFGAPRPMVTNSVPPPSVPTPMSGPNPNFTPPSVVKPTMTSSFSPSLGGVPRPMNGPAPTFGPTPAFGPTQPKPSLSFGPTPSNNSFNNQFNRPNFDMNMNSSYSDSQVEEILAKDILKNRVSSKQFNNNSSQDEVRQYMSSLVNRRQELLTYEEILKQRKTEIEDIMAKKGIKRKVKTSSSPNVKNAKVKSKKSKKTKKAKPVENEVQVKEETKLVVVNKTKKHKHKKKNAKKATTKPVVIAVEPKQPTKDATPTETKSTNLKVMKHKKSVSTDHLGKVHKANKQTSIVTRKKPNKK